jgi:tRNA modification GTPase
MHSTHVIELTPAGRAAIAVVLVAGPDATRTVEGCFKSARGRELADIPLNQIVLGRWGGAAGEELLLCRRSEERIEVHCHGGAAAVKAVIEQLVDRGCHQVSWQNWHINMAGDSIRAAAQIALADAPTARTAAILLDQYHGALSQAIQGIVAAISAANWSLATEMLESVLAYRDVGIRLTSPWRVVLAGATNVGKSSLLNALAGFQRSIVSHEPGTTRDVVTLNTAIDGWPVELADTAGVRDTDDELESAGVKLATTSLAHADLVLAISDAVALESDPDTASQIAKSIPRSPRAPHVIYVRNKIDLWTAVDRQQAFSVAGNSVTSAEGRFPIATAPVLTSAVTGEGISTLVSVIGRALVPVAPPAGCAVPFTAHHVAAFEAARVAVNARDASAAKAALQSLLSDVRCR